MKSYIKHTEDFIGGFKEEYEWLSNMQLCVIQWQGMYFTSVESAYQASKCTSLSRAKQYQELTGLEAKKHSKTISARKGWDEMKISIMSQLVFQKFFYAGV